MKTNLLVVLCVIFLIPAPVPGQDLFDVDEFDASTNTPKSFGRSSSNGNSWIYTEGNGEPLTGVQPTTDILDELNVKWQPVTIDELGEIATIRGQLVQPQKTNDQRSPIDWQQGVTVVVGRKPLTGANTAEPLSLLSDQSETENCITDNSGAFEITIQLSRLTRDKKKEQTFRCALALATHLDREQFGPIVEWSSEHKPLKHSYVDLVFPPNPVIDAVIEAIRVACENDFDPRSMILAVNALQPLGKEAALQHLEAFLAAREKVNRHFADADALFWILRLLFEPIELHRRIPVPRAFVRSVDSDVEPNWPLNPIVVVADIPFRFIGGGIVGTGMPEEPRSHMQFVRRHCVIRDAPLHPSRDPILIAQQLIESLLVSKMPEDDREAAIRDIRDQAFLLLPAERRAKLRDVEDDNDWFAIVKRSQVAPLEWSLATGFQEARD